MNSNFVVTGSIVGTGAALTISVGFIPRKVEIVNETDLSTFIWTDSMPDGTGMKEITAGTKSFMAAVTGISKFTGSSGVASAGFTLGTDVNLNAAADVIHYVATR